MFEVAGSSTVQPLSVHRIWVGLPFSRRVQAVKGENWDLPLGPAFHMLLIKTPWTLVPLAPMASRQLRLNVMQRHDVSSTIIRRCINIMCPPGCFSFTFTQNTGTYSPRLYNFFSCSTQLSMKISLLISMKIPTIVGIFIFIIREIFMLSCV